MKSNKLINIIDLENEVDILSQLYYKKITQLNRSSIMKDWNELKKDEELHRIQILKEITDKNVPVKLADIEKMRVYKILQKPCGIIDRISALSPKEAIEKFILKNPKWENKEKLKAKKELPKRIY